MDVKAFIKKKNRLKPKRRVLMLQCVYNNSARSLSTLMEADIRGWILGVT